MRDLQLRGQLPLVDAPSPRGTIAAPSAVAGSRKPRS